MAKGSHQHESTKGDNGDIEGKANIDNPSTRQSADHLQVDAELFCRPANGETEVSKRRIRPQLVCPICIHSINKGDTVSTTGFCHHVFHHDCLSAWLSTHSRICPYCRREILTQEMLNEANRIKLTRRATSTMDCGSYDDDNNDDHEDSDDDDDDSSVDMEQFSRYRP